MDAFILGSRFSPCMVSSSKAWGQSRHLLSRRLRRIHLGSWPKRHHVRRTDKQQKQTQLCQGVLLVPAMLREKISIRSVYELEPEDSQDRKDEATLYRRTVYDHEAWTRHRSNWRHAWTILSMARSKVILALGPPVLTLTLVAGIVASYNGAIVSHCFPSLPLLHVSALPFQLLAPALALLLVFRTNASYARFDEARRAWGSNVCKTRDIARQALCWIQHPVDKERLKMLLRHCVAYGYCMKSHMLQEGDLREELTYLLEEEELQALLAVDHRPNFCLMMMSEIIHSCSVSDMEQALMSKNITKLYDNLGTCERIFKTPIPLSYTRLTSRLLVIWHIALPLALWDQCKWIVIPATSVSAAVLFCIEEVGVLIEEPSQIFPLDLICTAASKNVDSLAQIHEDYILRHKKL